MREPRDRLEVRLYGKRAGWLYNIPELGLQFGYDWNWIKHEENPPLSTSLPVRAQAHSAHSTEIWFEGLLAEGNRRKQLARIVGCAEIDTWSLLRAAGGECAGAVQVVGPEHRDRPALFPISERRLERLLEETPIEPIGSVSAAARISVAGAQEKVVLFRNADGSWSLPVAGHPSSHILKPEPSSYPGLVMNEHWCMEVARRAALPSARTEIITVGAKRVLAVERYDRERDSEGNLLRIHQEDFAQALGIQRKYEHEGSFTARELFELEGVDRNELFDRMMFAWLIGNCDAHAKNFSLLEPGTARARLAPVYDMLCTECYEGLNTELAIRIGNASELDALTPRDVEMLGKEIGFRPGEATARLHELAHRTDNAMEQCEAEGISNGPVQKQRIFARIELACEWDRSIEHARSVR